MCSDLFGNLYIAFSGGGPQIYFNTDTVQVSGLNDLFISKYDATGNEVWKLKIGGPNTSWIPAFVEAITSLSYDSSSNCIYVSGIYYQTCTIDTISLSAAPGVSRGFLAKINVNGSVVWAKNFGNIESVPLFDTDDTGNLFMVFSVSTPGTIDTIPVTTGGYLGKMNTDGALIFIKRICGLSPQYPWSVYNFQKIEMINAMVHVFGTSYDSLTLDTILLHYTDLNSQVVSVWDTSGSILWAKQSGHSQTGNGTMCTDGKSNIYVMSSFSSPFITFSSDTLFTSNTYGAFLLKYDKFGNLLWNKTFSTGSLGSYGAILDFEGEVYFTGAFLDSLIIDNFSLYSSSGIEELFIARFDTSGNCIGVRQAGSSFGYDILVNSSGELYVTGSLRNTATFGSISIPSYGSNDIFLANLSAITGSGGGERIYNNQLIIYANPNKGSFRVQLPDVITDLRGALLTVYDVQGKEVARFNLENTEENPQLEINNATSGFYTVRLVKENTVFTGKLVVE
ncbi:MAG: T9SS type A sorting domain-containing protein [Bacteroidetes bacterium]|nr:T9SS type A sorting domain-containing protein [Bacteroidota bacterium]